jgi:1,2-diacylglycerol 3-alpha-glucosyltransferase
MRIGMMADMYKPHISGVTNYISLNKDYLEMHGHEVFVFTFKGREEKYHDNESNVIRSLGIPLLDFGISINLRYSKETRDLLQTMDIAHVQHPFISGPLTVNFCRRRGIPVVFTNHTRYDLYAQAYLPAITSTISETALETYMPAFCRSVDMVIAPSAGMRDVLRRYGVDSDISVIPNGVDIKPFREHTTRRDRSPWGFSPEDILLIYVGRIGPEKNLPFLLRSFRGVADVYDNVGLMLVGEGPEREHMQEQVRQMGLEERVRFTGLIPYEELPSYLSMADAFASASVSEVHPLSVIEAMASGLPVLGIQSPGVGDTIEDGSTGFLSKQDDIAGFTARMVRLVTDHPKRQAMGRQARADSEHYSIERTSLQLLECYKEVIADTSKRKRSLRVRINKLLSNWIR